MEEMCQKSHTSVLETRPSNSTMHQTEVQKNVRGRSELIEIFVSKRRQFVCQWASLQVWGCISLNGVGDLVRINGILSAERYKHILFHHLVPSGASGWPQMYSAAGL